MSDVEQVTPAPSDVDASPGTGWAVVIAHGGRYLGKVVFVEGAQFLWPVYELSVKFVKQGDKVGTVHVCAPIAMLPSIRRMSVPQDALLWPLDELTPSEQKHLMAAAKAGEDLVYQMRQAQAGIVTPTPSPSRIVVPR